MNRPNLKNVLTDLYNNGIIDEEALEKAAEFKEALERVNDGLEKEAVNSSGTAKKIIDKMSAGMITAAILLPAMGVASAASKGAKSLYNKATQKRDLEKILKANPDLAKIYNKKDIESYYNTLRTFAPKISKDPNAARGFLMNALQYKDVGLPVSVIKEITSQQKTYNDSISGGTEGVNALSMGMKYGE